MTALQNGQFGVAAAFANITSVAISAWSMTQ
jgi:hypothetical protein